MVDDDNDNDDDDDINRQDDISNYDDIIPQAAPTPHWRRSFSSQHFLETLLHRAETKYCFTVRINLKLWKSHQFLSPRLFLFSASGRGIVSALFDPTNKRQGRGWGGRLKHHLLHMQKS